LVRLQASGRAFLSQTDTYKKELKKFSEGMTAPPFFYLNSTFITPAKKFEVIAMTAAVLERIMLK